MTNVIDISAHKDYRPVYRGIAHSVRDKQSIMNKMTRDCVDSMATRPTILSFLKHEPLGFDRRRLPSDFIDWEGGPLPKNPPRYKFSWAESPSNGGGK